MRPKSAPAHRSIRILAAAALVALVSPLQPSFAASPVAPAVFAVATEAPYVALTFDDGPSPMFTPEILAVLSAHHAHGTFFLLGSMVKAYPRAVRQIVAQGSEAEAHGFTHKSLADMGRRRIMREVRMTDSAIEAVTGVRPLFFRPPYGAIGPALRSVLREEGQIPVLWSIDTRDWSGLTPAGIAQKALAGIRPGDIILFHDGGGNRAATLKALGRVLPALEGRHLVPVTLSTLWRSGSPLHHEISHAAL